jgi:hypothetical protein
MTEGERRFEAEIFFHHVQVGMTHSRSADLHEYLSRAGRRLRNVGDLSGPTNTSKPDCLHDFLLTFSFNA